MRTGRRIQANAMLPIQTGSVMDTDKEPDIACHFPYRLLATLRAKYNTWNVLNGQTQYMKNVYIEK